MKEKIVELVKARNFSATDFLGWHPSIESPHVQCSSLCQICGIRNSPEVRNHLNLWDLDHIVEFGPAMLTANVVYTLQLKVCARCYRPLSFPSVFTKYASALLATYYAGMSGVECILSAESIPVSHHCVFLVSLLNNQSKSGSHLEPRVWMYLRTPTPFAPATRD